MANKKKVVRFTIDFVNKKIIGTKASFNKASKGFGPEYEELSSKLALHPDFTMNVKEQKQKSTKTKQTYEGLDFSFMEKYIAIQNDSEALEQEYKSVKEMAEKIGTSIYPFVKKWFFSKFSTTEAPFDMDVAKQEISDYYMSKAVVKPAGVPAGEADKMEANEGEKE